MSEEHDNEEMLEEAEDTGFMSYEELMEARKISFEDIKEHLTGPVISTVIHVVLLAFLGTIIVFKAPEKSKEITVEMKTIEPTEIEPPPPPPDPPDEIEVETPTDTPIERPNMDVDVDVQVEDISVDTQSEVELPSVLNMKMSNSALSLPVNPGGGRKGGKIGGGFGYGSRAAGDLVGVMYDLKTNPSNKVRPAFAKGYNGNPTAWNTTFWGDIQKYIDAGLKYNSKMGFRQMKKKLFLSHLYIPRLNASEGPKQFGLEKDMQPSGFFIHYSGEISPKSKFRFVGQGDDTLIVFIDKKMVWDASWNHAMAGYTAAKIGPKCFTGMPIVYGDWISPGKHRIDVLFGERPGGLISGVILVEEKNKTYPQGSGRPILPIFTTQKLNKEEKARIASQPWTIATDGPVMYSRKIKLAKEKPVTGLEIE